MRDSKRIGEILELLKTEWEKVPDWRLGQLLSNSCSVLFYVEDEDLIEKVQEYLKDEQRDIQ